MKVYKLTEEEHKEIKEAEENFKTLERAAMEAECHLGRLQDELNYKYFRFANCFFDYKGGYIGSHG